MAIFTYMKDNSTTISPSSDNKQPLVHARTRQGTLGVLRQKLYKKRNNTDEVGEEMGVIMKQYTLSSQQKEKQQL